MPDALCYIASLAKISNKFDYISVGYIQNNGLKQPQIIPSAENIWNIKTGELERNHENHQKMSWNWEELDFNI